jgi:hypothetical protein
MSMVRTINETFSNEEFEQLKEKKGKKTWREYILELAGIPDTSAKKKEE